MHSERSNRSQFAGHELLGRLFAHRLIVEKREPFSASGSIMPPAGPPSIARCCYGVSGREAQLHSAGLLHLVGWNTQPRGHRRHRDE